MTTELDLVERELRIAAPPEVVFEFFTDPAKLVLWMGREAELDPRPGGIFRLRYNEHDIARGAFVSVEPARRVAFTWGWEAAEAALRPGASLVEVTLVREGDGTRLVLRHTQLSPAEARSHAEGWDRFLRKLEEAARV